MYFNSYTIANSKWKIKSTVYTAIVMLHWLDKYHNIGNTIKKLICSCCNVDLQRRWCFLRHALMLCTDHCVTIVVEASLIIHGKTKLYRVTYTAITLNLVLVPDHCSMIIWSLLYEYIYIYIYICSNNLYIYLKSKPFFHLNLFTDAIQLFLDVLQLINYF